MPNLAIILLIIAGLIVIFIFWTIAAYNGLVTLRNRTQEAWSDIDVQLKRRYDLIPNLVETVKGYATHERETLDNVVKARTAAMSAQGAQQKADAENALSGTLKTLFAVTENYPDLKASQNFLQLQEELTDAEDKIQAARRFYNGNARDFNTAMQVFPTNVIAARLSFTKFDYFEITDASQRENVQVKF